MLDASVSVGQMFELVKSLLDCNIMLQQKAEKFIDKFESLSKRIASVEIQNCKLLKQFGNLSFANFNLNAASTKADIQQIVIEALSNSELISKKVK